MKRVSASFSICWPFRLIVECPTDMVRLCSDTVARSRLNLAQTFTGPKKLRTFSGGSRGGAQAPPPPPPPSSPRSQEAKKSTVWIGLNVNTKNENTFWKIHSLKALSVIQFVEWKKKRKINFFELMHLSNRFLLNTLMFQDSAFWKFV